MEAHPISIITVLISGSVLLLSIIAFLVGTTRYVTARMEAMIARVDARIDTERDKTAATIEGMRQKGDVRYDTLKETIHTESNNVSNVESKARHDLANAVTNNMAAMRLQMDTFAKREEMRETEQRLTITINKVGDKVDKLGEVVGKMEAMSSGITTLTAQLDRMAMRLDNHMPKMNSTGGD